MEKDIQQLKEAFRGATSKKELEEIDKQMSQLAESNISQFAESMLDSIRETNREIEDILLREKLNDVLPFISVSNLVKTYFKKTPQWFYQRLNGNTVNGKPAKFSKEEMSTLANALTDISEKLKQSVTLVV